MTPIQANISKIISLCKKHKVKSLYAFGSVITSKFNKDSDIDLLVDFDKPAIPLEDFSDNFFSLMYELQEIFGRKVDLLCNDAIRNRYFREELEETKKLIYGTPTP